MNLCEAVKLCMYNHQSCYNSDPCEVLHAKMYNGLLPCLTKVSVSEGVRQYTVCNTDYVWRGLYHSGYHSEMEDHSTVS